VQAAEAADGGAAQPTATGMAPAPAWLAGGQGQENVRVLARLQQRVLQASCSCPDEQIKLLRCALRAQQATPACQHR